MTVREDVLVKIIDYFASEQWTSLQRLHEMSATDTYHAHVFVDTSLHPLSFCDVLREYFKAKGMEIDRPIDLQASNTGYDMLHGIHPRGSFHFDIGWRYVPGSILKPMPPELTKGKGNLQTWGRKEVEEFFGKFAFIQPGPREREELRRYFESDAWDKTCEYVMDNTIVHFHANVEMSVHPDALMEEAVAAIGKQGWELQKTVHCIFSPRPGWTTGKVVFLLARPTVMFDIAWKFTQGVVIRPSTVCFMLDDDPRFDVRRQEPIERFVQNGDFVSLTDDELSALRSMLKA